MSYLDREISWFRNTFATTPVDHTTVRAALEDIRTGRFLGAVEHVRATPDKTERSEAKKTLAPAYTFRGQFSRRNIQGLIKPSGIIDIDLDDVDTVELKSWLRLHPNVLAYHDSISGHLSSGLRVLVPVEPPPSTNEECHQAFNAVCREFGLVDLADALKDISRLSYTSYDPDLFINEDAAPVHVVYAEPTGVPAEPADTLTKLTEGKKYIELRHIGGLLHWGGCSQDMIETALQALRLSHSDDPGEALPISKVAEWISQQERGTNLTTLLSNILKHAPDDVDLSLYNVPVPGRESYLENGLNGIKNGVPDSRSLRDGKVGKTGEVIPMFGFERPPPRLWVVDKFMPAGYVTLLAADGGTGKSYLAVMLSICVALGIPFLGLPVVRGRVLYIDFELNDEEMKRRYWSVLAGLDMTPAHPELEDQLYYLRPRAALSKISREIREIIARLEPVLIIVDSLTIASMVDASSQADITPVMQMLETFGTVLCLDHLSRASTHNVGKASAFGSIFKRNHARSTWNLAKADAGGLMLVPDKNNFAPPGELVTYNMTFREDMVCFSNISLADESLIGGLNHLPTKDVTFRAILELTAGKQKTCTIDQIVAWRRDNDLGISDKTARNHITMLQKEDKAVLSSGDVHPTLRYSTQAANMIRDTAPF